MAIFICSCFFCIFCSWLIIVDKQGKMMCCVLMPMFLFLMFPNVLLRPHAPAWLLLILPEASDSTRNLAGGGTNRYLILQDKNMYLIFPSRRMRSVEQPAWQPRGPSWETLRWSCWVSSTPAPTPPTSTSYSLTANIRNNWQKAMTQYHAQVSCVAWRTAPTSTSTGLCKACISTIQNHHRPQAITHCKTLNSKTG